jgi:hypothetical protein
MTDSSGTRLGRTPRDADIDPVRLVGEAIGRLRFGGIHLTIHEGKLVQMDVTEKRRFT